VKIKKTNYIQITKISEFFKKVNIISLHIHANPVNLNFINKNNLKYLRNDIIIINTSRGDIINENDLVSFLQINRKAKYYTDVLKGELLGIKQNPIYKYSKITQQVFIIPHIGGMTIEGQLKAFSHTAKMLIDYINNLSKKNR